MQWQAYAGSEKALQVLAEGGGGGSTWLRGGSIEPVEPPLATGMDFIDKN